MDESRFHRAAKEGQADILRHTTKRDCNSRDDLGMTPTLISASKGNMDCLRILISRGGDPDLCDNQGYTALHFAAMNGKLNVVTFLVSFGSNIWALTNDTRNALQLAKENDHHQIADLLDDVYTEQETKNKNEAFRKRQTALKEANDRTKKLEKQWKKTLKKEQKLASKASKSKDSYSLTAVPDTANRDPTGKMTLKETKKKKGTIGYPGMKYGTQRSARSSEISYGPASELFKEQQQQQLSTHGLGSRAGGLKSTPFFNTSASMMAMTHATTNHANHIDNGGEDVVDGIESTFGKPLSESLAKDTGRGLDQDYLDDVGDDDISSPLELFLAVNDLSDYLAVFVEEDIDLNALMLLDEKDMKQLSLGLGPRKKLLKALENRKKAIDNVKCIVDTSV